MNYTQGWPSSDLLSSFSGTNSIKSGIQEGYCPFNLSRAKIITTALSTRTGWSRGKHREHFFKLSYTIISPTSAIIELLSVRGRTQNYKFESGSDRSRLWGNTNTCSTLIPWVRNRLRVWFKLCLLSESAHSNNRNSRARFFILPGGQLLSPRKLGSWVKIHLHLVRQKTRPNTRRTGLPTHDLNQPTVSRPSFLLSWVPSQAKSLRPRTETSYWSMKNVDQEGWLIIE